MSKESTTLYYREGTSDKVYQAAIEKVDGGFVVNFAFGRRGSTLQTGNKTQSPVPYDKAKVVFDSLVKSKLDKGYTPGPDGTPYSNTIREERNTDIRCQLCNPISESEARDLLADPSYWMQEKFDGKRILIRKDREGLVGINRKGLVVSLSQPILKAAQNYDESFVLDGECVGDTLHAFDILALHGESLVSRPYFERRLRLETSLPHANSHLVAVETLPSTAVKTERFLNLKFRHKEGVVFKRYDAPYTAGRPASGGPWLKCKFTTTGSFIVNRVNERRSVGLELYNGSGRVEVGNVTIPANAEVPQVGSVIEVRFLYAYKGGSLFQPVFVGVRDDIVAEECTMRQLKYRVEDSDDMP